MRCANVTPAEDFDTIILLTNSISPRSDISPKRNDPKTTEKTQENDFRFAADSFFHSYVH
jgi:hypothetical protein